MLIYNKINSILFERLPMRFISCLLGACANVFIATSASAQDCSAVLAYKAFDVNDSSVISEFQKVTLDEMCKKEWSSVDEYNNKARSLGSGGQYNAVSGFLNLNSGDVNKTLHTIFDQICVKKLGNVRNYLFSASHSQVARHAVEAWQSCIEKTTLSGLWSAIDSVDENKTFAIRVRFRTPTGKLTLKGYPRNAGYTCQLGQDDIIDLTPADKGYGNDFTIQCNRTDSTPQAVQVWIDTNVTGSTIGPFTLPSTYYFRTTTQVRALEQRTLELEQLVAELAKKRVSVEPAVSAKVFGNGGSKTWLSAGDPFWTGEQDTIVNYSCGENSVLAGMNFVMHSENKIRGPHRIEYLCKSINWP